MVAPIIAAKAAGSAKSALTGDIFTQRWQKTIGKGKNKTVVDREVRVNPVGLGIGALAIGATVLVAGATAWVLQLKLTPTKTSVTYGKWVWPDGQDVDGKLLDMAKMGKTPSRPGPDKKEWLLFTGNPFAPYSVVPEGTAGAVYREWQTEVFANAVFVETKEVKRFSIEQRPAFNLAESIKDSVGLGQPIFGKWSEGQFWAKK